MIEIRKFITRRMLRDEPDALFVFGDNVSRSGFGGQAKEMRGEPNAVGVPTKWSPSMSSGSFFSDDDLDTVVPIVDQEFQRLAGHLLSGGKIVWPEDGVGTGMAELEKRAPRIWSYIEKKRDELFLFDRRPRV